MKTRLLVLLILLFAAAPFAHAAFYQWTDAQGVVHLTDDPRKIPKRYQKSATEMQIPETPPGARDAAPVPQPRPQASRPQPTSPGGHPEMWWRQRFGALRGQLQALEATLPEKQEQLTQLRRKWVMFRLTRDRVAANAMEAEVSALEVRISGLREQIAALEQEAVKAEVPAEWRR